MHARFVIALCDACSAYAPMASSQNNLVGPQCRVSISGLSNRVSWRVSVMGPGRELQRIEGERRLPACQKWAPPHTQGLVLLL
jgi:hypothetical protein